MKKKELITYIGAAIKRKRKAKDITAHELAKKVGVSRSTIANIENAHQAVLAHQLFEIAKNLGLDTMNDFFPSLRKARGESRDEDKEKLFGI